MSEKRFRQVTNIMPPMPCQWSVGTYMERFYQDLGEKKFTGVKCPKCKTVYVPPRKYCSCSHVLLDKFVPVKATGVIVNYTVAYQKVDGSRRDQPVIIGLIKLDGADTAVFGEVRAAGSAVAIGTRVKAVFADKPGNTVDSVSHFEPAKRK
jgi:uncharacterized OB-fold protein